MKKITALFVIICMITSMLSVTACAENTTDSLETQLNSIWLDDEDIKAAMRENFIAYKNEQWETKYSIAPQYARNQIGLTGTMEEQYQTYMDWTILDYDKAFKVYSLTKTSRNYAEQYAQNGCFDYLISTEYYWAVPDTSGSFMCVKFDKDGGFNIADDSLISSPYVIGSAGLEYLCAPDEIISSLSECGADTIDDIKIVVVSTDCTCLYIKSGTNEYLEKIYHSLRNTYIFAPEFELFKMYTAVDAFAKISEYTAVFSEEKPTYEAEAQSLQADGLLQGNENGLDLLKPLTRAEAVTLLIRAMGEESETVNYTESVFSDIASDNWASPYAALAKAKGITAGVSETEFAPDTLVTADQFAAFTLRAAGITDFDYTEAAEILIERGLITAEQAESMDLFTRGDMAKIVYEAKAVGLL